MAEESKHDREEGTHKQQEELGEREREGQLRHVFFALHCPSVPVTIRGGSRTINLILAAVNIARCLRPALPTKVARRARLGEV